MVLCCLPGLSELDQTKEESPAGYRFLQVVIVLEAAVVSIQENLRRLMCSPPFYPILS